MPASAQTALDWLQAHASRATLDGMVRYGIPSDNALGVTMADMKRLAQAVWATGVYASSRSDRFRAAVGAGSARMPRKSWPETSTASS